MQRKEVLCTSNTKLNNKYLEKYSSLTLATLIIVIVSTSATASCLSLSFSFGQWLQVYFTTSSDLSFLKLSSWMGVAYS